MKKEGFLSLSIPGLEETGFWARCGRHFKFLLVLLALLLLGILGGSYFSCRWDLFQNGKALPLIFSGIPEIDAGFFSSFSSFLLNQLIFLTISFLLGVTAFGTFAVPVLVLFRGVTVGFGVSFFLCSQELSGLGGLALRYTPGAAGALMLFLLFSLRALVFSDRLRQAGFTSRGGSLDFRAYCKDYLCLLCWAVAVSLFGGALSALGSVFLS